MAIINKPSYIFRYHVDKNGNIISVKVDNEEKQVSPVNNIVMLDQIPSETERLVIQGANNEILTEVENMDEITSQTFYCDYNEGKVYFDSTHQGKTKIISYYGRGLALISADRVFLPNSLSNGDVIETIQDLIDFGKECLELIKTLGDAVKIIQKLEQNLAEGKVLNASLETNILTGTPLNTSLKDLVPRAETSLVGLRIENTESNRLLPLMVKVNEDANTIKPLLEQAVASATDINDKIVNTGNKSVSITTAMWGTKQVDGYHYIWTHPMKSQAIKLDVYEVTPRGKELCTIQAIIKDNNNIEFISDVASEVYVVGDSRYYGGNVANLNAFSSDDLLEGTNNKYIQSKSFNLLANQFTLVEGLYEATLTHSLNRKLFSNKKAFVNEKEIVVGWDEISSTQIKIFNTVAEDCKIVLQWNGGL